MPLEDSGGHIMFNALQFGAVAVAAVSVLVALVELRSSMSSRRKDQRKVSRSFQRHD
jgi:mannose/fructose/N-acetylgalactosamine-specific phosphotransferase system component IIC